MKRNLQSVSSQSTRRIRAVLGAGEWHPLRKLAFVFDVFFEQVGGEDIAFEQEVMIGFERIEHFTEGAGNLLDEFLLFGGQFVQVRSCGSPGSILFKMPSRPAMRMAEKHRYGLLDGIWCAEFNTLGLGALGRWDAADRRAIAL